MLDLFPLCTYDNAILNNADPNGCTPMELVLNCFAACSCQVCPGGSGNEGAFQNCVVQSCASLLVQLGIFDTSGDVASCVGNLYCADFLPEGGCP